MDILQSVHNYLSHVLNKKSRIDGRFIVIAILLGYFSLLFISSFFTDYTKIWEKLGIPVMSYPFADLRNLLSGFECHRLGYDVLVENPCDPSNRQVTYPRLWMELTFLGLEPKHTVFLGIVFVLLFYISTLLMIGKLNYFEGLVYSSILCSPPVMFLIERANTDIIIFSLLSFTLVLQKNTRLIYRCFGYMIIAGTAWLKLFSIFCLTVILKEKRKIVIILLPIFVIPFLLYQLSHLQELRYIARLSPDTPWFSYGYKAIFIQLFEYFSTPDIIANKKSVFKLIYGVTISVVLGLGGYQLLHNLFEKFRTWLSQKYDSESTFNLLHSSSYIDEFRLGCSAYIGTFMLGSVFDYKLTFMIFAIPQIIDWIKKENKKPSFPSSIALVGIIATLYLSPSYRFCFDEVINWFLLGYFVYSFSLSLPDWLKSSIHKTLSVFL